MMNGAGAAPVQQSHAPRYVIQALEGTAELLGPFPTDINNHGMVAGTVGLRDGSSRAFLYENENGRLQALNTPRAQSIDTFGLALNAYGDVVGTSSRAPVLFRRKGAVELFPVGARYDQGFVFDINDAGLMTGVLSLASTGQGRASIHDGRIGTVLELQSVSSASGVDVNNAGEVLIQASSGGKSKHFIYHQGAYTELLPPRKTGSWSFSDINDVGQVAGYVYLPDSTVQAFIYQDGDVLFLPGVDSTGIQVRDVNNRGWVLGNRHPVGDRGRSFVYRDGHTYFLKDLIDDEGQWSAMVALAMNDREQVVGFNEVSGQGFLATPMPESGTTTLLLAGLCAIGWVVHAGKYRAGLPS